MTSNYCSSSPLGVGRILLSQVEASPLAGRPLVGAAVVPARDPTTAGAWFSLSESNNRIVKFQRNQIINALT